MIQVTFRLVNGENVDRKVEQLPDRTTADLSRMANMVISGFEKWMREKKKRPHEAQKGA